MQDKTLARFKAAVEELTAVAIEVHKDGQTVLRNPDDHIAVIRHYDFLRRINAVIKEARESLSEAEESFSREHIPNIVAMLKQRTGQKPPFHIEGVGRVGVSYRFSASIKDDVHGLPGKLAGHNWLIENGHEDLIVPTVNAATLSAFAKRLRENDGVDLPDDIFKVGTQPYTSITKE